MSEGGREGERELGLRLPANQPDGAKYHLTKFGHDLGHKQYGVCVLS